MTKKGTLLTVVEWILHSLTVLVCCCFLLTCLIPFISPDLFTWVGFAGLACPFLATLLFFVALLWLFAKPMWALVIVIVLGMGYQQIEVMFGFHLNSDGFSETKNKKTIRIIDWNVRGFNGLTGNKKSKKMIRTELAASIINFNADIVCLQEFNHSYATHNEANNIGLFSKTYKYYYYSRDYQLANGYTSGSIIFSKFPIVDSAKLPFPKAESMIYADIVKGKDTIRVYTTHLQSFKFKKNDYDNIDKLSESEEEAIVASKSIFYKMRPAFKRRSKQANMIHKWLKQSPYPSLIAGDFNDVPNSYTYFTIRNNWQDAFLKTSFGIGRTFASLSPTLRIDYVLADNAFKIHQFDINDEGLSDHYMLISDLELKK